MRDYVILTDSSADLTAAEVAELSLRVLSLSFTVDGQTLPDTPEHSAMSSARFYELLAEGKTCSTAAVSVGQYADAMRAALDEGLDVLCVCFSGALSTTYQSACIAADDLRGEYPDAQILVVDSRCASRGLALLLHAAVREKRAGRGVADLAAYLEEQRGRVCHWFTVADLSCLKRGGRVSAAAAFAGSMLGIKPVLHMDDEGRLVPVSKARGMKAALTELVNRMERSGTQPLTAQTEFLCHAACPENAAFVQELLRTRFGVTDVRVGDIGPVIGSHVGGGTLGLFFLGETR